MIGAGRPGDSGREPARETAANELNEPVSHHSSGSDGSQSRKSKQQHTRAESVVYVCLRGSPKAHVEISTRNRSRAIMQARINTLYSPVLCLFQHMQLQLCSVNNRNQHFLSKTNNKPYWSTII